MKVVEICAEGLPKIEMMKNALCLDQLSIECNPRDFTIEALNAWHLLQIKKTDSKQAEQAVLDLVDEVLGEEVYQELLDKIRYLEEDLAVAKQTIEDKDELIAEMSLDY